MTKGKKFVWIKPPSEEMEGDWKRFLTIGFILKRALKFDDLFTFDSDEVKKLLLAENKVENEEVEKEKSEEEGEENIYDRDTTTGLIKFRDTGRSRGEYLKNPEKVISILKNESFPFLKGDDIPLSAKVIIAILSSLYAEECARYAICDLNKIFSLIDIPLEKSWLEGEKLFNYAKSKGSYLEMSFDSEDLNYSVWLNKRAYKEIFAIETKMTFPMEHFPENRMSPLKRRRFFFDDPEHKSFKRNENRKQFIPEVTLDDVVLPDESKLKVRFIVKMAQAKKTNFTVLFYGPPGTGKTYTAQAIAGELHKNLEVFDLSKVLNMFVGGTEKIISSSFEMAQKTKSIIFIDEADSFLKERVASNRTWENSQVNHLLSLIEKKKVSVILCTNLYDALDPALLRRMDELIEFTIPSEVEREEIWKKELKKTGLPFENIDFTSLRKIKITGGLIANAVSTAMKKKFLLEDEIEINGEFLKSLAYDELKKMNLSSIKKKPVGFGNEDD